jgi:septal ring factor EnvC (AmiA/AmiB activator)
VDPKSIDKAIQRLTAIVETQSKKFGAVEGAVKFTHTKMESSIGDLGKKLNSLEQRISKLDKKVQACQKQNEERLEKLESRLNTAIRCAEQASVEANAAREGFVKQKTDFSAKLQLLQDQVQQQLDQLQKTTSDVVANHTKRQDESVSEKLRAETELTSTLSTLTNLVERQGQQLAHLVQNSVSAGQPQQQASPLQMPQMIVGQQPYTAYSNGSQMVAPQFLPPQSNVTYQQQPHWPMPTDNGAELSRLFRHLRNYPGFNSFQ